MTTDQSEFQVTGTNKNALFTLKAYRGEGMLLLAMNWKNGEPPIDFVGFSIEYQEPDGDRFYALKNRISFKDVNGHVSKESVSFGHIEQVQTSIPVLQNEVESEPVASF